MKSFILSMFILFFAFDARGNSIDRIIETIPHEHREDLTRLFKMIFLEQDGAYTLFGDKPVSLSGAFLIASWESMLKGKVGYINSLWHTWQMYKHLFPIQKYLIIGEKFKIKKSNLIAFHIFVIKKEAFINSIKEHQAIFEKELNRKIHPEDFLQDIERGKISLWEGIKFNEMLLGILLGYGAHNASIFNRRNHHFFDLFCLNNVLEEKKVKLEFLGEERYPMMIVNPVQFAADLTHPETIALKQKYKKMHEKVSAIYLKGDFLEITLSKLTEPAQE